MKICLIIISLFLFMGCEKLDYKREWKCTFNWFNNQDSTMIFIGTKEEMLEHEQIFGCDCEKN